MPGWTPFWTGDALDNNYSPDSLVTRYGKGTGDAAPGGLWNQFDPNYNFVRAADIKPELIAAMEKAGKFAPRANPYNAGIADQSRAGQMALYQQMQAARAGPSIAAMQGAGAQGQNVRSALMGGSGVARMAAQQGAGMGGDVSQAVLGEQMRASQGLGGLASGLRGRDLQGAQSQAEAALKAQALDNAARQFYAGQTGRLLTAREKAELENFKLYKRGVKQTETDLGNVGGGALGALGTLFAGAV